MNYPLTAPGDVTRLTAPERMSVWTEEIGQRNLLPAEPGEVLVGQLGIRYVIEVELFGLTRLRRADVESHAQQP